MLRQLLVTSFFCFLLGAITVQAQFVKVNSPMDLEGVKAFDAAAFGEDLTTGIWTSDVVLADDGIGDTPDACDTLINGADVDGKIVLIDRGECEFGDKCSNAEKAGAIAVIVFNNEPDDGTFSMGAGVNGGSVNIPCVMLSYEDGQLIKAAMANGPVNISIGAISVTNFVGISEKDVSNFVLGAMPVSQIELLTTPFTPAATIRNLSTDSLVTGASLSCNIDFTPAGSDAPTNVYNGSDTLASVDTFTVVALPDYTPTEGAGTYDITYLVDNDSTEENFLDDEIVTSFAATDSIYSKSRWDFENNRPLLTGGTVITVAGGGEVEFLMGIRVPNGVGFMFDKVSFYAQTGGNNPTPLEDIDPGQFGASVYEWVDANGDNLVANNEVTHVGFGVADGYDDPTSTSNFFNIQIFDINTSGKGYPIPDVDKQYFIGANYRGDLEVFFGFDLDFDHDFLMENTISTHLDFPFWQGSTYNTDQISLNFDEIGGLQNPDSTLMRGAISMGVTMVPFVSNVGEINPEIGSFEVYPNPVSDYVNVEAQLAKNYKTIDYTIVNSNGVVVSTVTRDIQGTVDNANLDVSDLPAGQYFLHLKTEEGAINKAFTVQR